MRIALISLAAVLCLSLSASAQTACQASTCGSPHAAIGFHIHVTPGTPPPVYPGYVRVDIYASQQSSCGQQSFVLARRCGFLRRLFGLCH